MRYSPKPHRQYLTHTLSGPGSKFLYLPAYWNLAWLTLPDIEQIDPAKWQQHPIETAISQYMWVDLKTTLDNEYPLRAVDLIVREGVDELALCDDWDDTTFDTMMERAREADARLRAEFEPVVVGNVIKVNFRRRA